MGKRTFCGRRLAVITLCGGLFSSGGSTSSTDPGVRYTDPPEANFVDGNYADGSKRSYRGSTRYDDGRGSTGSWGTRETKKGGSRRKVSSADFTDRGLRDHFSDSGQDDRDFSDFVRINNLPTDGRNLPPDRSDGRGSYGATPEIEGNEFQIVANSARKGGYTPPTGLHPDGRPISLADFKKRDRERGLIAGENVSNHGAFQRHSPCQDSTQCDAQYYGEFAQYGDSHNKRDLQNRDLGVHYSAPKPDQNIIGEALRDNIGGVIADEGTRFWTDLHNEFSVESTVKNQIMRDIVKKESQIQQSPIVVFNDPAAERRMNPGEERRMKEEPSTVKKSMADRAEIAARNAAVVAASEESSNASKIPEIPLSKTAEMPTLTSPKKKARRLPIQIGDELHYQNCDGPPSECIVKLNELGLRRGTQVKVDDSAKGNGKGGGSGEIRFLDENSYISNEGEVKGIDDLENRFGDDEQDKTATNSQPRDYKKIGHQTSLDDSKPPGDLIATGDKSMLKEQTRKNLEKLNRNRRRLKEKQRKLDEKRRKEKTNADRAIERDVNRRKASEDSALTTADLKESVVTYDASPPNRKLLRGLDPGDSMFSGKKVEDPNQFKENLEPSPAKRRLAVQSAGKDFVWYTSATTGEETTSWIAGTEDGKPTVPATNIIAHATTEHAIFHSIGINIIGNTWDTTAGSGHYKPRVKISDGSLVARTQCADNQGYDVRLSYTNPSNDWYAESYGASGEYANSTKLFPMSVSTPPSWLTTTEYTAESVMWGSNFPFAFLHGGLYKLCYAPDGYFGPRPTSSIIDWNWLPSDIFTYGVQSNCNTANCLKTERWECWYPGLDENPADCKFAFTSTDFRLNWLLFTEVSKTSKMTWSLKTHSEVYDTNGKVTTPGTIPECRLNGGDTTMINTDVSGFTPYITMDQSTVAKFPKFKQAAVGPSTMRVCYCSDYSISSHATSKCTTHADFIQTFGTLYVWRLNICDYGNAGSTCSTHPNLRVTPHQKFVLQVDCPPGGGCDDTDGSRISLHNYNEEFDKAFWEQTQACGLAAQEDIQAHWPGGPGSKRAISGGTRQDFKMWKDKQVRVDLMVGQRMAVCFCRFACDGGIGSNGESWYRIGTIEAGEFSFAARAAADGTMKAAQLQLATKVGKPGAIIFYGGVKTDFTVGLVKGVPDFKNYFVSKYDAPRFSDKAVMKIFPYDSGMVTYMDGSKEKDTVERKYLFDRKSDKEYNTKMNSVCQVVTHVFDTSLMEGTEYPMADPLGNVGSADTNAVTNFQSFIGDGTKRTTFKQSGIVGVCYCAILDPTNTDNGGCSAGVQWRFAGLLQVAGPQIGQRWALAIDVVTKLTLFGSGFAQNDILRLIPYSSKCTDNNNNPVTDTSHKIGCASVDGKGCITQVEFCPNVNGETCDLASTTANFGQGSYLMLQTLGKDQLTPPMGIKRIVEDWSTDQYTVLEFVGNIQYSGLQEGDTIVISKHDLLFDGANMESWKHTNNMREAANVLTNNIHMSDASDPSLAGLSNALGWKVSFFRNFPPNSNVAEADKPKYIQIPLKYKGVFKYVESDPIVWYQYPYLISFKDDNGGWYRSNKIGTNSEIKGVTPTATDKPLRVCWGKLENSQPKFYQEAGLLDFIGPSTMPQAYVSLSTTLKGTAAPAIVSFETGNQNLYKVYSVGMMHKLVLRFVSLERLDPVKSGDHNPFVSLPDLPVEPVLEVEASQNTCGELFVELWSNDREGFPLPSGCYFSKKYRDAAGGSTQWREFVLLFGRSNGIKGKCQDHNDDDIPCRYQITMNAKVAPTSTIKNGEHMVDIYTRCDGCAADGSDIVFEVGKANVNMDSPTGESQAAGDGSTHPVMSSFQVPLGGGAPLDLTTNTILDLGLVGGNTLDTRITKNSYLRIYLYPLLQWQVPAATCSVQCKDFKDGPTQYKCGTSEQTNPTLENSIISLTPMNRKNMIKIRFPDYMEDPISNTILHGLTISSLEFPTTGFFPIRWAAQLTNSEDLYPVFRTSSGTARKEPQSSGRSTARIVINGATGYGPRPYSTNTKNEVFIRFQFGATLFHNGKSDDAAYFEIIAPKVINKKLKISVTDGVTPPNLPPFYDFNQDGYLDYNHGTLGTRTTEGEWKQGSEDYIAVYKLKPSQVIHANQAFFVKLRVDNPEQHMTKMDTDNTWYMKLFSKGWDSSTLIALDGPKGDGLSFHPDTFVPGSNFATLKENSWIRKMEPKLWYQNIGIVNKLMEPVLSPNNFIISTPMIPQFSDIYVFFKSATHVGRAGYLKVTAPCGWDFGHFNLNDAKECSVGPLPRYYYDYIDLNEVRVQNLTDIKTCRTHNMIRMCGMFPSQGYGTGQMLYNRAIIHVGDNIGLDPQTNTLQQYGFALKVHHSYRISHPDDFNDWELHVANAANDVIDGTEFVLYYQKQSDLSSEATDSADRAFGLYALDFATAPILKVTVTDATPTKNTGNVGTRIIMDGFEIPGQPALGVTWRCVAPFGFKWKENPFQNWLDYPFGEVGRLSWPCDTAVIKNQNQLTFSNCQFQNAKVYGWSIDAEIPSVSPSYSANYFYIEMGYQGRQVTNILDNPTYRYGAQVFQAPLVKSLRNAEVNYRTARSDAENILIITFRLVTKLEKKEGIIIEGLNKNAEFVFHCDQYDTSTGELITQKIFPNVYVHEGHLKFPSDYICDVSVPGHIMFIANQIGFEAGYYKIEVSVKNLSLENLEKGTWKFGTWKNVKVDFKDYPIDSDIQCEGFEILNQMPSAELVKFADAAIEEEVKQSIRRDDRPGFLPISPRKNSLLFKFSLKDAPNVEIEGGFILRGPAGFRIADDCSSKLVVDKNLVFGEYSKNKYMCDEGWENCGQVKCEENLSNPKCRPMTYSPDELYALLQAKEWPAGKEPKNCQGFNNMAKITVPVGLNDETNYIFRLDIDSNPSSTPTPNNWSVEYSGEASPLFSSFVLHTVTGLMATPVTTAIRSSNVADSFENPVEFQFSPFSTVGARVEGKPHGGILAVEAPVGFEISYQLVRRKRVLWRIDDVPLANGKTKKRRVFRKIPDRVWKKQIGEVLRRGKEKLRRRKLLMQKHLMKETGEDWIHDYKQSWDSKEMRLKGRGMTLKNLPKNMLTKGKSIRELEAELTPNEEAELELLESRDRTKEQEEEIARELKAQKKKTKKTWKDWKDIEGRAETNEIVFHHDEETDDDNNSQSGKHSRKRVLRYNEAQEPLPLRGDSDDPFFETFTQEEEMILNEAFEEETRWLEEINKRRLEELEKNPQSNWDLKSRSLHIHDNHIPLDRSIYPDTLSYDDIIPTGRMSSVQDVKKSGIFKEQERIAVIQNARHKREKKKNKAKTSEISFDKSTWRKDPNAPKHPESLKLQSERKLQESTTNAVASAISAPMPNLPPGIEFHDKQRIEKDLDMVEDAANSGVKNTRGVNKKTQAASFKKVPLPQLRILEDSPYYDDYEDVYEEDDMDDLVPSESSPILLRHLVMKMCKLNFRTTDLTTVFNTNDIQCEVVQNGKLEARIMSIEKSIVNSKTWLLTIYVYNKPSIEDAAGNGFFEISSYDDERKLLDVARIDGYPVLNIMGEWKVTNTESQLRGVRPVKNILMVLRFPDLLQPDDVLDILAPLGFDLRVEGTAGQCNGFEWVAGYNPLPKTIVYICPCPGYEEWYLNGEPRCGLRFSLIMQKSQSMNTELRFLMDTTNPSKIKTEIGNHWVAFHRRKIGQKVVANLPVNIYEPRATAAAKSWDVIPQLQNVVIAIAGADRAAEAYTDISISFEPVQNAVTLLAIATQPAEFKFDSVQIDAPFVLDGQTRDNVLIVNSIGVQENVARTIVVKNVKLGKGGGQTMWNLRTYGSELTGGYLSPSADNRDERMDAVGFIMPGKLFIEPGKFLESDYKANPSVYPMQSEFSARENELNTAELLFGVSQTVYSQSYLVITCEGANVYLIDSQGFSLTGPDLIDQQQQVAVINVQSGALEVNLNVQTDEKEAIFKTGDRYKVRFRVTPRIGKSKWRLETFSKTGFGVGGLPTNTNDGREVSFDPVARLVATLTVMEDRRPPQATIDLKIDLQAGSAGVNEIIIVAPPTFEFPVDCSGPGMTTLTCKPYITIGVESRKTASLISTQGKDATIVQGQMDNIRIRTITPPVSPSSMLWFIQTWTAMGKKTGWEKLDGFEVKQMSDTSLWYPNQKALQGAYFSFSFYLSVNNGKTIRVIPPVLYELYCSLMPSTGEPAFFQISLPGKRPACKDSPMELTLETPLLRGHYSFVIGGDVPSSDPASGARLMFTLIVMDDVGMVLDAAYEIPAFQPLMIYDLKPATLNWGGTPKGGKSTDVHVGITFGGDEKRVKAILITLPDGFIHNIKTGQDCKNLNKMFPVAPASQWVDYSDPKIVRILVDDTRGIMTIERETYKWQFPVMNPEVMPPQNVWYISICTTNECRNITNEAIQTIPLTFPVPGYTLGEVSKKPLFPSSAMRGIGGYGIEMFGIVFPIVLMFGIIVGGRMM